MKPKNSPKTGISIPVPCFENWHKMNPEEQGRHCQVCSKTVIDFTGKSIPEVKSYIQTHSEEKICGRFDSAQIDVSESRPLNSRFSIKRFVLAIWMILAAQLSMIAQDRGKRVGKIAVNRSAWEEEVQGMVEVKIMGEVGPVDTALVIPIDTTSITDTQCGIESNGEVLDLTDAESDSLSEEDIPGDETSGLPEEKSGPVDFGKPEEGPFPDYFMLKSIFPVPARDKITVSFRLENPSDISLNLIHLNGAFVKELMSVGQHHRGEYTLSFNVGDLPTGSYYLQIICGKGINRMEKILIVR